MKYCRYLLVGLMALVIAGCGRTGQTVDVSLKQQLEKKSTVGAEKTIVILPFADYSDADDLETAYRRSLFVNENLTDQLTSNSYNLPVQEDVFMYLVKQNIINPVAYGSNNTYSLEDEMQGEWSDMMKGQLERYSDLAKQRGHNKAGLASPGTHGLTPQEIVKIGRYYGADYIMRGRIIQYKTREDASLAPLKKGIIGFITGSTNKLFFGQARSDKYDNWGNMIAGGTYGAIAGSFADGPWDRDGTSELFGLADGQASNAIFWGVIGAGLGHMANNTGKIPQAVVQLRIWVQDAYNGDVVWTNRIDVKVSPQSVFADHQYDALFESATEKGIDTLIANFVDNQSM